MVRIRNFRSLKCWFARGHAWVDLEQDKRRRCRRCGISALSYHWDWKPPAEESSKAPAGQRWNAPAHESWTAPAEERQQPTFDPQRFAAVRDRYRKVGSWAVWARRGQKPCDNMSDLSVFDVDRNILSTIHTRFVLVALNVSKDPGTPDWSNFHLGRRDFMLRDALLETPLWGAYLTGIVKGLPEKKYHEVLRRLRREPNLHARSIASLRAELEAFGPEKPVLVALGVTVERILRAEFSNFQIARMPHYSAPVSRSQLREEVMSISSLNHAAAHRGGSL